MDIYLFPSFAPDRAELHAIHASVNADAAGLVDESPPRNAARPRSRVRTEEPPDGASDVQSHVVQSQAQAAHSLQPAADLRAGATVQTAEVSVGSRAGSAGQHDRSLSYPGQ